MSSVVVPIRHIGGLATDQSQYDATVRNWYRVDEVQMDVNRLNTQSAIFYRMLELFRRDASVMQPKYTYFNDNVPGVVAYVTGGNVGAADTVLTVDDATIYTPNTLILNQTTEELMLVESVDTTTQITVERGVNGTSGVALTITDGLMALGAGLGEKGLANLANTQIPAPLWNYVSFFSIKKQVTELQDATQMNLGVTMPEQMQLGWFELQRQVSQHLIWSRKAVRTDAAIGRVYYTDGFVNQVLTNRMDLGEVDGIITWPMLNDFLRATFKHTASSPSKALICGEALFAAINTIDYNKVQPATYSTELGTTVSKIRTDEGGMVDVVLDRYSFPGVHTGVGLLVDLNNVSLKNHNGFGFMVRPNIQSNDSHIREDEIYGSESVCVKNEEVHAVLTGCKGPY